MALEDLTTYFTCHKCNQKFELGLYKLLLELETVTCPRCKEKALHAGPELLRPMRSSVKSAQTLCLASEGILPVYTVPFLQKQRLN